MERQLFGFEYQKQFCDGVLIENLDYTGKFDAYTKNGFPIQIKTYKNRNGLGMADPFRYIKVNNDFILVVTNYIYTNKVVSERIYYIDNKTLKGILLENNFERRANYCKWCLDSVSNDRCDDARFRELMLLERKERKSSIINMEAKRDHKNQKRVQWSIPNRKMNIFLSNFREISKDELIIL